MKISNIDLAEKKNNDHYEYYDTYIMILTMEKFMKMNF